MKSITELLTDAGIPHYNCSNVPGAVSDLSMAWILCSVCQITAGNISLEKALAGQVDLLDRQAALARHEQRGIPANNRHRLRQLGYLKWHSIEKRAGVNGVYDRYTCHFHGEGWASGPVREDRICGFCKQSVDE